LLAWRDPLIHRVYRELWRGNGGKTLLVYGAADAGEMIVRDMGKNPEHGYNPIGFVDDDATKVGTRIHGVPVLGTRDDLARIVRGHKLQEVLSAIRTAGPEVIRQIVRRLEPYKITIKTVPNISGRCSMAK
jgi:FlaA1/EpsC-like NDP-sugar epimerase